MNGIIDKTSKKVKTEQVDDEHFIAYVTASFSPTFFGWVVRYGGDIKIINPKEI